MSALLELAKRCEAATGPDQELDWDILKSLGRNRGNIHWSGDPYYTASLDAAMTLAPEPEGLFRLDMSTGDKFMWATIYTGGSQYRGEADNLVLALCAAALRARAATPSPIQESGRHDR